MDIIAMHVVFFPHVCEIRENLTLSFAYLAPPVRPLGGKVMYVTIHNPLILEMLQTKNGNNEFFVTQVT